MGLWDEQQWAGIASGVKQWSGYILAAAMAGVGLSTSFRSMRGLGIKPFYVGLLAAVTVGMAVLGPVS